MPRAKTPEPSVAPKLPPRRLLYLALYGGLLAFAFFLLFYNLGDRLFWGDEAETAVLARNVTRFGLPKTFDGLNRVTLFGGGVDTNDRDIWSWSPWLQEYIAAAGFYCLGPSTWAGRVPFAVIGWLCIAGAGWLAFRFYRDHWVALATMALLGTSEVFLLHCRQCRYYSVSVFAELVLLLGIYQFLSGKRTGMWTVAAGLVLHFYSNYVLAVANVPLLLVLGWMLYRERKSSVLPLAFGMGMAGVAAVPWLLFARSWHQYDMLSHNHLDRLEKTLRYLLEYHFHFLPLVFGLMPGGAWLWHKWTSRRNPSTAAATRNESPDEAQTGSDDSHAGSSTALGARFETLMLLWLPLYAAVLANAPGIYMRYLLPLLPPGCLLVAVWLFRYIPWRSIAVALILVQCTTNALPILTAWPLRGAHFIRAPLVDFIDGITHPYHERLADVVDFLRADAQPGQTLMGFDPEFPLMFYTSLKLTDGRFITVLTEPLPDWILSESASGLRDPVPNPLPDVLKPRYEAVSLQVHNSARTGSMPEPDAHQYRCPEHLVPFVIYKKRPAHDLGGS
jgi:hypothetical protein